MLVTLLGIVTLVRLAKPENAAYPMLVTGRPLITPGITITPPDPLYLVIATSVAVVV
jgi:hypothetical protein